MFWLPVFSHVLPNCEFQVTIGNPYLMAPVANVGRVTNSCFSHTAPRFQPCFAMRLRGDRAEKDKTPPFLLPLIKQPIILGLS